MNPINALTICGGAARWTRLRELGVTERALAAAASGGVVLRVGHGGYVLPDAHPALVAAVTLGGTASHVTAAALHGWPIWTPDDRIHVTVPSRRDIVLPGVEVHQARLGPAGIQRFRACTTALRTALDCARFMPFVEAVCTLDGALRAGTLTVHQLNCAAELSSGPGGARLRRAIANLDPRSASALESVLRMLLVATGRRVRSQMLLRNVGAVDFLVDEWLTVEGDGYEFHSNREDYKKDRRRGNGLTVGGHALLRFTYEDVRGRPLWVIDQVQQALAQREPSAQPEKRNARGR